MLHFLFTTGRTIAGYAILPSLVLAIVVPVVMAWRMGKGGGRTADDADTTPTSYWPVLISSLIVGLTVLQLGLLIFGGWAVVRGRNSSTSALSTLLVGPNNVKSGPLISFGVVVLMAAVIAALGVHEVIRDGGWLREQIDAIRDPGRRRGESGSAHFCSPREF